MGKLEKSTFVVGLMLLLAGCSSAENQLYVASLPQENSSGTSRAENNGSAPKFVLAITKKDLGQFAQRLTKVRYQNLNFEIDRTMRRLSQPLARLRRYRVSSHNTNKLQSKKGGETVVTSVSMTVFSLAEEE